MCDHDEISKFFLNLLWVDQKRNFLLYGCDCVDGVLHFFSFSLMINIKKPLKHDYITHLRNCFTSPKASRLNGFV